MLLGASWDPSLGIAAAPSRVDLTALIHQKGVRHAAHLTRMALFETQLPPLVIAPVPGEAPSSTDWYLCPLKMVMNHSDLSSSSPGAYIQGRSVPHERVCAPPSALVAVRTSLHPVLCALRAVCLVAYV